MKTGNVIATKGRDGTSKGAAMGKGTEKAVTSPPETAAKGKGAGANIAAQKFLSVRQVAERWGSSESTVRRLIEEGKLNGIRLRHACRLSIVSVDEYEKNAKF